MQTSIATVSLSGGLAEKLEAIAAAGFTGVEIFESDLLSFNGTPKDVARMVASLGLKIVTFQPFRDFEGMPEPQRSRTFARAERKFDLMGELGCDLLMICSNVAPDSLGGIDRAAADFHELGERAQKRGIRVGFEALAWGRHVSDYRDFMGGGAPRRSSGDRAHARQLPYLFPQDRSQGDPLDPRRQDRAGAACRRAVAGDGCHLVEPAFPLLSRPGRISADRIHGCGVGDRLWRASVARNLQRSVSRGLAARCRHRWPALAGLPDGSDARARRRARRCRAANPAAREVPRHRVSRIRSRRPCGGKACEAVCRPGLQQGRRAQVEGGDALVARADQSRPQQRQGGLRALASDRARALGLRPVPEGGRCDGDARPRRKATRHAVSPGGRAGRIANSRGAGPRRKPAVFRRSEKRARPAVGYRFQRARKNRRATAAPASRPSITCRSPCTTRRCCPGCCSTIRCWT